MDSRQLRGARGSTPSFIGPLLNTLDSMRGQESTSPDQLNALAEQLMWSEFGSEDGVPETAHAHAAVDLMAEHARYVDGFGLHIPVEAGCSVSVRLTRAAAHRVCGLEGEEESERVLATLQFLVPNALDDKYVEASIVSSIPPDLCNAGGVPAVVATVRAMGALLSIAEPTARQAKRVWENRPGPRGSVSGILASASTDIPGFILTDVRECESIPLGVPALERPGFALIGLKIPSMRSDHAALAGQVKEAEGFLRDGSFSELESLRDLVHKDLDRALLELPRRLRPIVNFLVTENGRVQKLVAAIQRRDWQMLGALLLMSHASKYSGLKLGHAESDFVVKEVENMILDGMYGATLLNSYSGAVLVSGQRFSVPPALERLRVSFKARFGYSLSTLLL